MRAPDFIARLIVAVAGLGFISTAFAQDNFVRANQEYASGHFREAIDAYEQAIREGKYSANVFYDLGNAYFHAGDFGHAILNYERALVLDPHHPEAQANLRMVRDEAQALELSPGRIQTWASIAGTNQYALVAAAAFWIGAFSIVGWVFSRRRSTGILGLSILSLSLCIFALVAIFLLQTGPNGRGLAIITGANVTARLATADSAQGVLALPPGSEIKMLSERGDWVYAALPNNLRGWIPAKHAEVVRL